MQAHQARELLFFRSIEVASLVASRQPGLPCCAIEVKILLDPGSILQPPLHPRRMLLESDLFSIAHIPFELGIVDPGFLVHCEALLLFLQLVSVTLYHYFVIFVALIGFSMTCLLKTALVRLVICTSSFC